MSRQPIRTHSSKQIIEALDERLATALAQTDVTAAAAIETCIGIVRSLLPYVESDAVQRVLPGIGLIAAEKRLDAGYAPVDDPSDPSLPFVAVAKQWAAADPACGHSWSTHTSGDYDTLVCPCTARYGEHKHDPNGGPSSAECWGAA